MKYSLIKKVNSNYMSYTINYLFILIINKVTVLPLKYKYIGKPGRNYYPFFFFLQGIKTGCSLNRPHVLYCQQVLR